MEAVKETGAGKIVNDTAEEIIKPHQKQPHEPPADNKLQQQQQQQQQEKNQNLNVLPETKEEEKVTETAVEKKQIVQQQGPQIIHYEEHDDYDDDDDEKETSQKLVIDIPEEDEEEKEDEEEEDDDDVIAIDSPPQEVPAKKENAKIALQPQKVEAIITLSDGEDETVNEAASKPGKIQKRRSMGAGATNEKEQYRLKRRKINAAGAPKLPQTGYLRFLNDRRESMRKEHPSKTYMEHNKMIGEEWHALASDVKSSYLKAADMDKQRYVKELHSFLKSRPDILASELAKNKVRKTGENSSPNLSAATASSVAKTTSLKDKAQTNENVKNFNKDKAKEAAAAIPSTSQQAVEKSSKRKRTPTPPTSTTNTTNASLLAAPSTNTTTSSSLVNCTPAEIPIFTNEFLEHNKIYDMELRSLRKSKTDLEQQNSVLEKHVENMKFGVEKMITENNELEEKNRLLEIYLDKLKRKLAMALSTLPLPTAPNGATVHNIDKYMQDLYKMSTSNSTGPATLNKAKDIIRKLDLQIHF